jgi:hypothetical protein
VSEQEAVQKLYRWAMATVGDRKAGVMELYVARLLEDRISRHSDYREAYQAVLALLEEYRQLCRPPREAPAIAKVLKTLDAFLVPAHT